MKLLSTLFLEKQIQMHYFKIGQQQVIWTLCYIFVAPSVSFSIWVTFVECSTIKPVKKSQAKIDPPAKAKEPLPKTHPKRIWLALQEEQKKHKGIGKCNCSTAKRNI